MNLNSREILRLTVNLFLMDVDFGFFAVVA